ncbi:YopX family protein [Bacillus paralicheniformis]|uniref:YopX family protein n=1 Tax=Bacillus TaxID=1386 RepID=UPI000951B684|nr:YopX family protein [Bacillus paralicheniformis]TWM59942.1 hypothetical protein CHCC14814_2519 [Bacillus paralicheniformis]
MREIKFRAWNKELKKFVYSGDAVMILEEDGTLDIHETFHWDQDFESVSDKIVLLQYTGLKDETGREIWEGDIRKDVWGRKFKVVYDNDLAAFYGEYINGPSESLADCGPDSEYLGTVYENPELLEVAE